MKSLSLVAIILALAACQAAKLAEPLSDIPAPLNAIDNIIVDALESCKLRMVEGWPQYGIPPLAPFEIQHKDFNFGTGELHATGALDGLVVRGLNEFEIRNMSVNPILSRIKFELQFASLNLTTQYEAQVDAGYQVARNGGAFLALEDLNMSGQIKYATGVLGSSNNLRIKGIELNIVAGNVVSNIENLSKYRILNRKLNDIVEEFISLTINENTDLVADWVDSTVTPICNDLIGDRSIKDILDLIGGGSK
ncbi:uncharacterized protein LOC135431128 isoform X1 [Drosophila montana]|uniref:uncharacterized protein LOC135431128 isoform X1 n=1 Tax=Drosophila montana TaxID=40370 RepID=UPI00313CF5A7